MKAEEGRVSHLGMVACRVGGGQGQCAAVSEHHSEGSRRSPGGNRGRYAKQSQPWAPDRGFADAGTVL